MGVSSCGHGGESRSKASGLSGKDREAGNEPGNPGDAPDQGSQKVGLAPGMLSLRALRALCARQGNSRLELGEKGGADKSSVVTFVCRIAQVARARETGALRGSRVSSEEALEVGRWRGATWTSASPALKWEQGRGMIQLGPKFLPDLMFKK